MTSNNCSDISHQVSAALDVIDLLISVPI
ncbi:MAG: hypothetical protein ACR5K4_01515 [Sodalis sp. (in: enterobacteria)]